MRQMSFTARSHSASHSGEFFLRTSLGSTVDALQSNEAGSGLGLSGRPILCSISLTISERGRPLTKVMKMRPG